MPLDFDTINRYALSSYPDILDKWLPGGRVSGREYECGDLSGGHGDSLRVNISSGKWSDFAAAGVGGTDPISLYAAIRGLGQGEAARELAEFFSIDTAPPPPKRKPDTSEKWTPVIPVPADAPPPPDEFSRKNKTTNEWEKLPLVARWTYHNAGGNVIGHVARFARPDGGKEIVPQTYCEMGGKRRWKWLSFPQPRPLYGLDRLAAAPDANVIIVEGEKCVDDLQAVLDGAKLPFVVVSWPGGSKAVRYVDYSPLSGRKIVLWPDFDAKTYEGASTLLPVEKQPGMTAMQGIQDALGDTAQCRIMLYTPGEKPDGWDCADAISDGWDAGRCLEFLKARVASAEVPPDEPPEHRATDTAPPDEDNASRPPSTSTDTMWTVESGPFQILGYDHGGYFYLPRGTRQVVELSASGHSKQNLLALAPRKFWEKRFPGESCPVSWDLAANAMLRACERRGVYDPGRIRGRGAWEDDGRAVLHLGSRLLVDGHACEIDDLHSSFIYEAAAPLDQGVDAEPLPTKQAHRFAALCDMPTWESGIFGRLLAGWCVVAPICGALSWRPHIWCTGPAGCGKSWVMDNILRPAIGPAALCVQSNTTEAGLRQLLKYDARPVLFDEAEGENSEAGRRIQTVLELMRQASSETGAAIVKGSSSGRAQMFRIRSMFAFSSIGVGAVQKADNSRLTVLSLVKNESPDKEAQFDFLKSTRHELLTDDYLAGLRARTVRLLPVIRRNASTFARAAAGHLGSQRAGDQVGALLAGAYSLYSASEISAEDAARWVSAQDWGEAVDDGTTDEHRCLAAILEAVIRVDTGRGATEMSVGEAVAGEWSSSEVTSGQVRAALERSGIKREADNVMIVSNTHSGVARILRDTAWSKNWARILARLPGAERTGPVRFAGSVARGVSVILEE